MATELNKWWGKKDCADAWGLSKQYVRHIMFRVPGAKLTTVNGKATWKVPPGSVKPTNPY